MKKHIWFVPVNPPRYQPRYPEYKWRCRMRCWDIWRCWGPKKKELQLATREEGVDPIVSELNTAPLAYYNKYLTEGHLYEDTTGEFTSRALSSDWTKEWRLSIWADTVEYRRAGGDYWSKVHHSM